MYNDPYTIDNLIASSRAASGISEITAKIDELVKLLPTATPEKQQTINEAIQDLEEQRSDLAFIRDCPWG